MESRFKIEYKKLNQDQKKAVDNIEGPVMVVAGPGTGKTQILALRIGNILNKTDVGADSVLCLTFTNSAVEAMQERLAKYIGAESKKVNVFTFHSFGMKIIEENARVLGFDSAPKLLDELDTVQLFDKIFNEYDWQYLRPRADSSRYFKDLRSLISLLSRERVSNKEFSFEIDEEIKNFLADENSFSSRGENKGKLKKEVERRISELEKTKEVAEFIKLYKKIKLEGNFLDYDDVLENLVKIVEESPETLAFIREKYLYVLVDEHQDSSLVQNEFLARVWQKVEDPNIFVVGDDRQLIYGFSGASIEHFAGFRKTFPKAKLITLVDNYRSTQIILDASHALLKSVMTDKKLKSQSKEEYPIKLVEASSKRAEILAAALDIKEKEKSGIKLSECAILMTKNSEAREAIAILHEEGISVSTREALNLFDQKEAREFLRILKVIIDPANTQALALSFFDENSEIPPVEATEFFLRENMREFSFDSLKNKSSTLFVGKIEAWIAKLVKWQKEAKEKNAKDFIKVLVEEILIQEKIKEKDKIVSSREILSTITKLFSQKLEKNPELTLHEFTLYLERLAFYNEVVPIEVNLREGVKVLTMHSAKGLEFDYVWLAHLDERSLGSEKRAHFTLPKSIEDRTLEQDVDKIKRRLYVAITRARKFCTLSYATLSEGGSEREISKLIADLPKEIFEKVKFKENFQTKKQGVGNMGKIIKLVGDRYSDRFVSASTLNNFFECPRKWYFNNFLQLPGEKLEILEFGSAVHALLDYILKSTKVPKWTEVEKVVQKELSSRGYSDSVARERMKREVLQVVKKWVEKRLSKILPSRKTEEGVSVRDDRFSYLKIYGKIDLIENLGGGEVRVTDFKTGNSKRSSEILKRDEEGRMSSNLRQLAMYSYLLERNQKWQARVRESRLEFVEVNNDKEYFFDTEITGEEIDLLIKDIKDYDVMLKNGTWVSRECNFNSYGKNAECEYCKLSRAVIKPS